MTASVRFKAAWLGLAIVVVASVPVASADEGGSQFFMSDQYKQSKCPAVLPTLTTLLSRPSPVVYDPSCDCCHVPCGQDQWWDQCDKVCRCPGGSNWNGRVCVTCAPTTTWSPSLNRCTCGPGTFWNGDRCIPSCSGGRNYNAKSGQCECPFGSNWDGHTCVTCFGGQVWSSSQRQCVCPGDSKWDGDRCVTCRGGQVWNYQSRSCECPGDGHWDGDSCEFCRNGKIWDGKRCVCPKGSFDTGFSCVTCDNDQIFNPSSRSCECKPGYNDNGRGKCVRCDRDEIWDTSCLCCRSPCRGGQVWDGKRCVCPSDRPFWTGSQCVSCGPNQDFRNGRCQCKSGFQETNDGRCIKCDFNEIWDDSCRCCHQRCSGGQVWDGKRCSCPLTTPTFTAGQCVPDCGPNQEYRNGRCQCKSGYQQTNDGLCIKCDAKEIFDPSCQCCHERCSGGRNWNGKRCECPDDKPFWNGNDCVSCSGNTKWDPKAQQCAQVVPTFVVSGPSGSGGGVQLGKQGGSRPGRNGDHRRAARALGGDQ